MTYSRSAALGIACLLLAACSGNDVKQTLGLNRGSPDEFRVVSRPPLSVPPDFTLRPPSNSDTPLGQIPASDRGAAIVSGKTATTTQGTASTAVVPVKSSAVSKSSGATDKANSAFLQQAGAAQADPSIRDKLAQDRMAVQDQQEEDDSSWWNVFSSNPPKKDTLVDAKKEQQRIQKDESQGQPVTEGDTPTVKDKDTGVLGRIFGY